MAEMLDIRAMMDTPIPEVRSHLGWQEHSLEPVTEPLISFEQAGLLYASFYSGNHQFSPYEPNQLDEAYRHVYIRTGNADSLVDVQARLPSYLCIAGLDGLRSFYTQDALRKHFLSTMPDYIPKSLWGKVADEYVSAASDDPSAPSPHGTGGTLDSWLVVLPAGCTHRDLASHQISSSQDLLRLCHWLPSGAPFDHGSKKAALRYFEENDGPETARRFRRLKYWIMAEAGFQPYGPEFWEFAKGTQKAELIAGLGRPAVYGAATLSRSQRRVEMVEVKVHGNRQWLTPNIPDGEQIRYIQPALAP